MPTAPIVLLGPSAYAEHHADGYQMLADRGFRIDANPYDRPRSKAELLSLAPGAVASVVGLEVWDREVIAASPNLRVLAKCGVGVDNIDLTAAREHGVHVTNAPGMNSNAVAELAVGLMLATLRSIPQSDRAAHAGVRRSFGGPELTGRTVGLIGVGNIGGLVAKRLRGFDVRVLAYDPFADPAKAGALGISLASLDDTLSQADIVSLHAPHTPDTERIIDAAAFRTMKRGAYLVNTSRGPLVDETALHDALVSGHLAGAGLDVFVDEPVETDHPLLQLPNVVATTHIAAGSLEAAVRIGIANAESIIAAVDGAVPPNLVPIR